MAHIINEIMLIEEGIHNVVAAPNNFDWLHYPPMLIIGYKNYNYIGTQDAVPVYKLVEG